MLVAAAILAGIAKTGRGDGAPLGGPPATATIAGVAQPGGVTVEAALTTNMRSAPDRRAELVAIIPGGRLADVTGQTPAGDWLRVDLPDRLAPRRLGARAERAATAGRSRHCRRRGRDRPGRPDDRRDGEHGDPPRRRRSPT